MDCGLFSKEVSNHIGRTQNPRSQQQDGWRKEDKPWTFPDSQGNGTLRLPDGNQRTSFIPVGGWKPEALEGLQAICINDLLQEIFGRDLIRNNSTFAIVTSRSRSWYPPAGCPAPKVGDHSDRHPILECPQGPHLHESTRERNSDTIAQPWSKNAFLPRKAVHAIRDIFAPALVSQFWDAPDGAIGRPTGARRSDPFDAAWFLDAKIKAIGNKEKVNLARFPNLSIWLDDATSQAIIPVQPIRPPPKGASTPHQ